MATEYRLIPDLSQEELIRALPEGVAVIGGVGYNEVIFGHGGGLIVLKEGEYRLSRTGAANNADGLLQALADALGVDVECYLGVEHFKPRQGEP